MFKEARVASLSLYRPLFCASPGTECLCSQADLPASIYEQLQHTVPLRSTRLYGPVRACVRAQRRQVFAPREFFPQFGRLWIIVRGAACRQGIVMAPGGVSAPDDAASSLHNLDTLYCQEVCLIPYIYCHLRVFDNLCCHIRVFDNLCCHIRVFDTL